MLKNKFRVLGSKVTALSLMFALAFQIGFPIVGYSLTSGPVQPEVRGFEPVGTSDMVDMFTGDFVYNIPLMDVDGYPINISYHSGIDMEAEASWVGLGWSLTPGAVNKSVRGIPDDFAGEKIEKQIHIKPEQTLRVGGDFGAELFGVGEPLLSLSASLGSALTMSNYKGVSLDFTAGLVANAGYNAGSVSMGAGANLGVSLGSQTGAVINYGANVGFGITNTMNNSLGSVGFNANANGVYSPRTGLHNQVGIGGRIDAFIQKPKDDQGRTGFARVGMSTGVSVPIGLQNYTAVISNSSRTETYMGRIKLGLEMFGLLGALSVFGSKTKTEYSQDGSQDAYGYFNLEKGNDKSLADFSREKDGSFNSTLHYLPFSALTYDVYSLTGQGTGGSFRPYRSDIGSVNDPKMESSSESNSIEVEAGGGNLAEFGGDYNNVKTRTRSGAWPYYTKPFEKGQDSALYEKIIFKEAGELSYWDDDFYSTVGGREAITPDEVVGLPKLKSSSQTRLPRANYIYTVSAADKDSALRIGNDIFSYNDTSGYASYPSISKSKISRIDGTLGGKKAHHVSQIIQQQKDGRRYVYGIPIQNNIQREVVFSIPEPGQEVKNTRMCTYDPQDASMGNRRGREQFYQSTITPTYTTSYLLSGVLASDYSDLTGDGISDDDLGSFTKFNYTRKSNDYRWRAPYKAEQAHYIPGYTSDKQDDKASFVMGSREQWYLHSIESKNHIAVFYVSKRLDGLGVTAPITQGSSYYQGTPFASTSSKENQYSYKLDSIALYNKQEKLIRGISTKPLKVVYFSYDYSLCKNLPNSGAVSGDNGKLTLTSIKVKEGASNVSLLNPYEFKYSTKNPDYEAGNKDRWGYYKRATGSMSNYDFPFVTQTDSTNDYASAWCLTEITLPSSAKITINYESDDYAYVQDRKAMEMFVIKGIGSSPAFVPGNQLYHNKSTPYRYLYFDRDVSRENASLSAKGNYLPETDMLYFNAYVELAGGKYERIKGYARASDIGYADANHGYIRIDPASLKGGGTISPISLTALNLGRYALNHILFPGADPDKSDISNIVAGLKGSLSDLVKMGTNPLENLMDLESAKNFMPNQSFVRLGSPGLRKKGGGCRVKRILFSDNWDRMSGGYGALYGKEYNYTTKEAEGHIISSGVASYEPQIGGDELPQREPVRYVVQQGGSFPPHDPIELYQETPVGESFFPSPVVGYSKVTTRSIHQANARSAQYEDVFTFYTSKDFPYQVSATPIQNTPGTPKVTMNSVTINQESTQGAAIVLNDMHGKQKSTEHYTLIPNSNSRELNTWVKHEYLQDGNQLKNSAPVYEHNASNGELKAIDRLMGIDADITLDSREHEEKTEILDVIASAFVFTIPIPPFLFGGGLVYPWDKQNNTRYSMAAATKIVQQYGIPHRVTQSVDGAVTVKTNEVWDPISGMPIVTSVNNEFLDTTYAVNYPAYWAYKELGPAYKDRNRTGFWNTARIDTLGNLTPRLTNWNPGLAGLVGSQHYPIPANMPVMIVNLNDGIRDFTLGDEILVWRKGNPSQNLKLWVVGYSADENTQQADPKCYLLLTTREPWKPWASFSGGVVNDVEYRVIRPGKRNRLTETIQTAITTQKADVLPFLKDSFSSLIDLQASTMHHALTLPAPGLARVDSLNPFVSLKAGQLRPEKTIINLKSRSYDGLKTRSSGVFASKAYWKTFRSNGPYCLNKLYCNLPVVVSYSIGYSDDTAITTVMSINPTLTNPIMPTSTHYRTEMYENGMKIRDTIVANSVHLLQFKMYDLLLKAIDANTVFDVRVIQYPCTDLGQRVVSEGCQVESIVNIWPLYGDITDPNYNPGRGVGTIIHNGYDPNLPVSNQWRGNPHIADPSVQRIEGINLVSNRIHFNYLTNSVSEANPENWTTLRQSTLYDVAGNELEEYIPGIGYNCAVYGYNATLPTLVAKNARYGEALFEGFEDYDLCKAVNTSHFNYFDYAYSPFARFWSGDSLFYNIYHKGTLPNTSPVRLSNEAHTGRYSLEVLQPLQVQLNLDSPGFTKSQAFVMSGRNNVIRFWVKHTSAPTGILTYSLPANVEGLVNSQNINSVAEPITNIIEGWQQFEIAFEGSSSKDMARVILNLPAGYYYDDFKITASNANGKGFVYNPFNNKLVALLDENNFATFYEYDASGNLIRTKKETERGIITLTESRTHSAK